MKAPAASIVRDKVGFQEPRDSTGVHLGQRSANTSDMSRFGGWSRCRLWIHEHVPFREQPFRDVAPILILLAPDSEGG